MAKSYGMRPKRIQLKAIFWHSAMFLLPVYSVWQGLYVQRQVWFSLLLLALAEVFFLFFVKTDSLCLQGNVNSKEDRDFLQALRRLFSCCNRRWTSLQKTVHTAKRNPKPNSGQNGIFGDYANDGKGQIAWAEADDDGITIETYLKRRNRGQERKAKAVFDWNWKNSNSIDDESYLLVQKQQARVSQPYLRNGLYAGMELFNQFRSDWQQICYLYFPARTSRILALVLFWLGSVLWFPVSYWLLHNANVDIVELGGFIYYGQSPKGSVLALLFFANLCLPILTTQVGNKLQHSLAPIGKFRMVYRICAIFIELGYSLASLLVLWFFISSGFGAASGLAVLLIVANLYLRFTFRRKVEHAFKSLLLFRQIIAISITLGILWYL